MDTDDYTPCSPLPATQVRVLLISKLEYALASGMSFLCTGAKGGWFRNYMGITRGHYVLILDLRSPSCSDGKLLHRINKYMYKSRCQ